MTVTDRFAGRRWRARLLRLRPILVALAGVLVIGGLVWVVVDTPVLGAHHVDVRGAETLDASTVREVADVPDAMPLARLDVAGIEARVAEVPQVADVEVRRQWPRTVVLEITERTPVARLSGHDPVRVVDAEGVAYPPLGSVPRRLPEVVLAVGSGPRTDALQEAAEAIGAMDRTLARKVRELTVSSRDGIRLELRDGAEVEWGSADHADLQAEVLAALLKQKASSYDVSVPGQPTIVP